MSRFDVAFFIFHSRFLISQLCLDKNVIDSPDGILKIGVADADNNIEL